MSDRSLYGAIFFELALGFLALVLLRALEFGADVHTVGEESFLLSAPTNTTLRFAESFVIGIAAAIPIIVAGWLAYRFPISILHRLRRTADRTLRPLFHRASLGAILALSIAAGWGEEFFFRGFLQNGIATRIEGTIGIAVGLVASSAIFGLLHWVHATYAFVSFLAGMYFGALAIMTGELLPSIVAHALYDFVAIWWILGTYQRRPLQVATDELLDQESGESPPPSNGA